jgi:hypothetical protein
LEKRFSSFLIYDWTGKMVDKRKCELYMINVNLTFPVTKLIHKYDERHKKVIVVGVV